MDQTTTRTTTCLLFLFISFNFLLSSFEKTMYCSGYYASAVVLALLVATLLVFVVRTTIVTWITVMVLLAFAGKRRRVLVKEGRKITSDVAMYLARVLVKERGFVALACATIFSIVTMVWL